MIFFLFIFFNDHNLFRVNLLLKRLGECAAVQKVQLHNILMTCTDY